MSRAIVVMMKRRAKPRGLAISILGLVWETTNPVIEGLVSKMFIRNIIETIFNINNEVFMVY